MLVSISINNYNYGRFLKDAIDSALNQTYPNTEVIVVDDGSTDNSQEIIESYGERIIPVLKENGGQPTAFHAGLAASKGDIICLLDSDDTFAPNKVEKIVKIFEDNRDINWCFHRLMLVDADLKLIDTAINPLPPAFLVTHPKNRIGIFNDTESQVCDFRTSVRQGKLPFDPPPTSGLCFTRSLLSLLLPMPPEIKQKYKYTYDGYLKFSAAGLSKGYFLDEELAMRRIHGSNDTLDSKYQMTKARYSVVTAYGMRLKFPEFSAFTSRLLARGVGTYWRAGGMEIEGKEVVNKYLSIVPVVEKIEVILRIISNLLYGYLQSSKLGLASKKK